MKAYNFFILLSLFIIVIGCDRGITSDLKDEFLTANPEYIGNSTCLSCHEIEFSNWKGSDHDKAMDHATDSSVLGDFDNVLVNFQGIESRFYKSEGKFYVYTAGPGGEMGDFEIKYTFGYWPLQQYLIPFEKGRLQTLPIVWDAQTESWYHMADSVYSGEIFSPNDWLYWTNNGQNWNGMCAECHSTNLNKNYDLENQNYNTEWSEINVSCEACHGPASKHLIWSEMSDEDKNGIAFAGFPEKNIGLNTEEMLNQCSYCHARRSSFSDFDYDGTHYLNQFIPSLVNENMYHFDGQIKEEDYVFASFMQSRMHTESIKCSDCHEPHNLRTKQPGNLLCLQCHEHTIYDTEEHHFHKKTGIGQSEKMTKNGFYDVGDGTQCVDCHMTGAKYMGVDFRRDHNFRIPRPDVSMRVESPDACTTCHIDMSQKEAAEKIKEWYPNSMQQEDYGDLFYRIAGGDESAVVQLIPILNDTSKSVMVRASAIEFISRSNNLDGMFAIEDLLNDTSALVRYAAVQYYWSTDILEEEAFMKIALSDSIKAIRIASLVKLLSLNYQASDSLESVQFNIALNEYLAYLAYSGDFAVSRYNLGIYYSTKGDVKVAINHLKEAIKIDDQYYPAMLELAVLYSRQGDNNLAEKWLLYVLDKSPENTTALRYLGLLKAELKEFDQAEIYFEKLISINPNVSRNYYNLSIIQQERNEPVKAEEALKQALFLEPTNIDYLYALAYFYLSQKQERKARPVIEKMIYLYPNNSLTKQLIGMTN